jgi:hypothetical protein
LRARSRQTIQPIRNPGRPNDFDVTFNDSAPAERSVACGSVRPGSSSSPRYTSSLNRWMPCSSHNAASAAKSRAEGTAPVGLLGKFTEMTLVFGRIAAATASRSSAQSRLASSAIPVTAHSESGTVSAAW